MTKEETSKVLALFSVAGVKFDGDKEAILNLWSKCLEDIELEYALKATERIIKKETELFANGLIAKVRNEAKFIKEIMQVNKNLIEDKNAIGRIGNGNR